MALFQVEAKVVAPLVEMITWLKLEMYSLKQKEHEYAALLQAVVNVFFRHTEANVLDACARAMHHCSTVAFGKNNKCFFFVQTFG